RGATAHQRIAHTDGGERPGPVEFHAKLRYRLLVGVIADQMPTENARKQIHVIVDLEVEARDRLGVRIEWRRQGKVQASLTVRGKGPQGRRIAGGWPAVPVDLLRHRHGSASRPAF